MGELISWLEKYPLGIVILLGVAAGVLYVFKLIVDGTIATRFKAQEKRLDEIFKDRNRELDEKAKDRERELAERAKERDRAWEAEMRAREKELDIRLARQEKQLDEVLRRRSSFEEAVLKQRFELVTDLSTRLEKITTTLNRIRGGQAPPPDFAQADANGEVEIVPLTEIFEDLSIQRLVLTDELYNLLREKALLVIRVSAAVQGSDEQWITLGNEWLELDNRFREAIERSFRLSEITW